MEWVLIFVIFVVAGLFTGAKAVIFGLGGGLVIVPVMYWVMIFLGVPSDQVMHIAIGTSLAVMIFTSIRTAIAQAKANNVIWPVVKQMFPFVILTALIGAYTSQFFHSDFLRYFFLVFLGYVIIKNWWQRKHFMQNYARDMICVPERKKLLTVALFWGLIASWLGNGGSVISVPFLRRHAKMPMQNATATSTTMIPIIAIFGTAGYLLAGLHAHNLPPHMIGYIYWPAVVGLVPGIFFGVPLGRKIADKVSDKVTSKVYFGLLIVIFASMLI